MGRFGEFSLCLRMEGKRNQGTGGVAMNHEEQRLKEARDENVAWRKWGPYLSERQWGTVRKV